MNYELPRERCLHQGAGCLSLRECLAVILGTGTRNHSALELGATLLGRAGSDLPPTELERAFFRSMDLDSSALLSGMAGMGEANRARLLACFELSRRYASYRLASIQNFLNGAAQADPDRLRSGAIEKVPDELRHQSQEWLGFVPIYAGSRIGEFCLIERGVRTHVNIDPAELFVRLLALRPRSFFMIHNHPSGDLRPSWSDLRMTTEAARLAANFGIELLAHAVIASTGVRWIDPHGSRIENSAGPA